MELLSSSHYLGKLDIYLHLLLFHFSRHHFCCKVDGQSLQLKAQRRESPGMPQMSAANFHRPGPPVGPGSHAHVCASPGEPWAGQIRTAFIQSYSSGHGRRSWTGNHGTGIMEGYKPLFLHLKMGMTIVFFHSLHVMIHHKMWVMHIKCLLLLLSRFSRVRLCETPQTSAH